MILDIPAFHAPDAALRDDTRLLPLEQEALDLLARGAAPADVFECLCRAVEQRLPGRRCGVRFRDGVRMHDDGTEPAWRLAFGTGDHDGAGEFLVHDALPRAARTDEREALRLTVRLAGVALRQHALVRPGHTPGGLPTREALVRALAAAPRHAGRRRTGVLVLDVDGYRRFIDTLGRRAGDTLLHAMAERLASVVRQPDLLAQGNGDEFLLALREADEQSLATVARRLHEALAAPFGIDGQTVFASVSMGGALRADDEDEDALLRRAETAVADARRAGRGRYVLAEACAPVNRPNTLAQEAALRHALRQRKLHLAYQPRISRAGRVVGVEALCRWRHPEQGEISPAQFIPLAEECGLIEELGDWVLEEACMQAMRWQAQGLPAIRMSVNVSGRQLDPVFLGQRVPRVLAATGLAPGCLELELTESVMTDPSDAESVAALGWLRQQGVRVVLDDFGTGYSALAVLHRFPLDGLKIDRSFIARLPQAADACAIVRAVLGMASGLGLETVAEGVETRAQHDWLMQAGCDEFQGWLHARAESPEAVAARLAAQEGRP